MVQVMVNQQLEQVDPEVVEQDQQVVVLQELMVQLTQVVGPEELLLHLLEQVELAVQV